MNKENNNKLPWNDYSSHIKKTFGSRVQKISIDAGFTCPNRDGTISNRACIYCTNESFSPFYCNPVLSVSEQLQKGIDFFSPKYKTQKYLAYFQSYTNTYKDISELKNLYQEALSVEGVLGLVIGTRPDCINEEICEMISNLCPDKYVSIEFGLESTNDKTLDFINRGHSFKQVQEAIQMSSKYNFNTGVHLIIGLPGENEEDFYLHARKISELPIDSIKIHQMQVLKNTELEKVYYNNPQLFIDLSIENYTEIIINFIELLNPDIVIERLTSESPKHLLIYPDWKGKKNFEISHIIANTMIKKESYQGKRYKHTTNVF